MINIGEVLLNLWESSGFSYIFANSLCKNHLWVHLF